MKHYGNLDLALIAQIDDTYYKKDNAYKNKRFEYLQISVAINFLDERDSSIYYAFYEGRPGAKIEYFSNKVKYAHAYKNINIHEICENLLKDFTKDELKYVVDHETNYYVKNAALTLLKKRKSPKGGI